MRLRFERGKLISPSRAVGSRLTGTLDEGNAAASCRAYQRFKASKTHDDFELKSDSACHEIGRFIIFLSPSHLRSSCLGWRKSALGFLEGGRPTITDALALIAWHHILGRIYPGLEGGARYALGEICRGTHAT